MPETITNIAFVAPRAAKNNSRLHTRNKFPSGLACAPVKSTVYRLLVPPDSMMRNTFSAMACGMLDRFIELFGLQPDWI